MGQKPMEIVEFNLIEIGFLTSFDGFKVTNQHK
jgi:hypothetical protein